MAGVTVEIDWYLGPRAALWPLFVLADDSESQLEEYLELGRVLVARREDRVIGHLQLVPTTTPGQIEVKNMAVVSEERRTGVGRALVAAALRRCSAEGWSRIVVGTAAADTGNLRFYQRVGFRLTSIEQDAFTEETGYPNPTMVEGIPLRDRVWLAHDLLIDHRPGSPDPGA
jgi:GNAT superfamily N-acetyltransferase